MMGLKPVDAIFIDKERVLKPIHILIPKYPTKIVTDEHIKNAQGEFINKILEGVIRDKSVKIKTTEEEELPYQSKIIMEDLKIFPFNFQSEREIRLNMNSRIITDNLDKLVKNGWIRRHERKIALGKGVG